MSISRPSGAGGQHRTRRLIAPMATSWSATTRKSRGRDRWARYPAGPWKWLRFRPGQSDRPPRVRGDCRKQRHPASWPCAGGCRVNNAVRRSFSDAFQSGTAGSATQLSGWDIELSEPKRAFIVPAKREAAAPHEKTGDIGMLRDRQCPLAQRELLPTNNPSSEAQNQCSRLDPSSRFGGILQDTNARGAYPHARQSDVAPTAVYRARARTQNPIGETEPPVAGTTAAGQSPL